ncbi:PorV/PorQ family protein [candidate division FCPU426 bacterium]|nr:PorV/PorQ family protein [candidate division FCPU426 bacterium]
MNCHTRTKLMLALCLLLAGKVQAAGTTGAEFLLSEVSAVTAALAAGQADQGGSAVLQRNPAGIMGQSYPAFSFTHFTTFGDTAFEQLEGVWPDLLEGQAAGRMFYASTYDFPNIDEFGQENGNVENHDLLFHLAYARSLTPDLEAGLGVKFFESALAGYSRTGLAVDLGVHWQTPWPPLSAGASLLNAGTMSSFDEVQEELPVYLNAGVGIAVPLVEHHQLKILSDINQPLTGDEKIKAAVGVEYNWQQLAFLRGGYRFSEELGSLSLGGGLRYAGFGLDYAYQPLPDLGANHRFTLCYIFQPRE